VVECDSKRRIAIHFLCIHTIIDELVSMRYTDDSDYCISSCGRKEDSGESGDIGVGSSRRVREESMLGHDEQLAEAVLRC